MLGSAGVQLTKTEKSEKMPCLTVMTELNPERQGCLSPSCSRQRQRLEPRWAGAVPVAKRGQCSWAPLTASKSSCILPHPSTHRNTGPSGLIFLTQNCGTHSMTPRCIVRRDTNRYAQRHPGLYPKSQHMSYRQDCYTSNACRQQTHAHK